MKKKLRKHGWKVLCAAIVILFTIMLLPRCAVWKQFQAPMDEFTWLATKDRAYTYERRLTIQETRELRTLLQEATMYDLREVAFDRIPGVFDGELKIGRTTYGVDLTSRLIRSKRELGWLSETQIERFKLLCLQPTIPDHSE